MALLDARLAGRTSVGATRARIELALVGVLLGAGPTARRTRTEPAPGTAPDGCEALAAAVFEAFMDGRFSSDVGDPCRVDARALLRLDAAGLSRALRVGVDHPLPGLDARAAMLRRLGEALRAQPGHFTADGLPGHLFDALTHHRHAHHLPHANRHHLAPATFRHQLSAAHVVGWLLDAFGSVWPDDTWAHRHAGGDGDSAGRVPFHALAQWLALSLVEPFQAAGVHVNHLDALTAPAGHRNGGLLLDGGAILPRDDAFAARSYAPGDEWVVEWRALTVALIDDLVPLVRDRLGAREDEMRLPQVLEGGTWAAGREIAAEARDGGAPPVAVAFDGAQA
jgi:hypothetical protein